LKLVVAVGVLVSFVLMTAIFASREKDEAVADLSPTLRIVLFSKGEPQSAEQALASLGGAERVTSLGELSSKSLNISAVVVDKSAFPDLPESVAKQILASGSPIIALNVPLQDLYMMTGYTALTGKSAVTGVPGPPDSPSYSFVWVKLNERGDVVHSSSGQKDFASGLFGADLAKFSLLAHGLMRDETGNIVSLGN